MSGTIAIPNYPTGNLVPGFYFSIDASKANTATTVQRALIVAQMITTGPSAGSAIPGQAVIVSSLASPLTLFGAGSQAQLACARYRGIDTTGELWVLPLADSPAAVKATGAIAIAGTATAAGTLPLYVDDQIVPVLVNLGDTAATVAASVSAAINAVATLPLDATAFANTGQTVQLTAVNAGLAGNDLRVYTAFLGSAAGEAIPPGITVTITQPTGGTQNPTTLATALATLGDKAFDFIGHAYNDLASEEIFETFLNDTAGRWSPFKEIFGHTFTGVRGTLGQVTALTSPNDKHATILPVSDSPASPLLWAAEAMAQVSISVRANPAVPISGDDVSLIVRPPTLPNRFAIADRQSLLSDGYATYTVDDSGTVYLERMVTTYTTNAAGQPDNSWQDVETPYTLMACIRDMRTWLAGQFQRKILVADGTIIPAGSPATTSAIVLQSAISRYRVQANQFFWAQDATGFARDARSQNAGGGVVKLLLPYRLANQLRVVAVNVQFTKP